MKNLGLVFNTSLTPIRDHGCDRQIDGQDYYVADLDSDSIKALLEDGTLVEVQINETDPISDNARQALGRLKERQEHEQNAHKPVKKKAAQGKKSSVENAEAKADVGDTGPDTEADRPGDDSTGASKE